MKFNFQGAPAMIDRFLKRYFPAGLFTYVNLVIMAGAASFVIGLCFSPAVLACILAALVYKGIAAAVLQA